MDRLRLVTASLALKDGLPKAEWYDLRRIARESVFDWDKVAKGGHPVNCWYNYHCSFNVYVKDGVALREETPRTYPGNADPDCPDFNPKGCNKGCASVHRMYDPNRLLYPMKRLGARGEGKWTRITWDQALDEITEKWLDIMVKDGPRAIMVDPGSAAGVEVDYLGAVFMGMRGMGRGGVNAEVGDDNEGAYNVCGKIVMCNNADDFYYTDMVVIWGGNPNYTAQTMFHFFPEARYRGAKVVVISPDYNPTAPIADLWISVKPGSDGALALAMMQVILEEGLEKEEFISEQTDLPLLVRMDNRKFLRENDLKKNGRDWVFYMWDKATNKMIEAPFHSLALEGRKLALDGEWEVQTLKGKVKVRTVMSIFKENLNKEYTPEKAAQYTGVGPKLVRQFAREFATIKGASNMSQNNFGKYYHGNLMQRAQVNLWSLCGHMGRHGAGYAALAGGVGIEKQMAQIVPMRYADIPRMLVNHPKYPEWKERGYDDVRMAREAWHESAERTFCPTSLYYFFHAGILDQSKKYNSWDPHLKRPLEEYVNEAVADGRKGGFSPDRQPKALVAFGGDPFRRVRSNHGLVETLLPKLELVVNRDLRWTATALYSDYVLPMASWYENEGTTLTAGAYMPFIVYSSTVVEPAGESKNPWWYWTTFFTKLSSKARARGIKNVTDPDFPGGLIRVDNLDTEWTCNGLYGPDDQSQVFRDSWETATNVKEIQDGGYDELARVGYGQVTSKSNIPILQEQAGEFVEGEPFVANTAHVVGKKLWPTLTGRMQFYIDHDWYLELGEEFAWHKDAVKAGGDYPLQMTSGHARWSVHTGHAEDSLMLQLQRGEPLMFISVDDAEARGIKDADHVEVYNDVGSFETMVTVSPSMMPGQCCIYHQWTNSQYKEWKHFQRTSATPFNPIEFAPAGVEYPNIRGNEEMGMPGFSDRDTRVEMRKVI